MVCRPTSPWKSLVRSIVYEALAPLVFRQRPNEEGLELIALVLEGAIRALCPPGLEVSVRAEFRNCGFCVHVAVDNKGEVWEFTVILTSLLENEPVDQQIC